MKSCNRFQEYIATTKTAQTNNTSLCAGTTLYASTAFAFVSLVVGTLSRATDALILPTATTGRAGVVAFGGDRFIIRPRRFASSSSFSYAPLLPTGSRLFVEKQEQQAQQAQQQLPQVFRRTDAEWKELLSPDEYHVLREEGTEPPFSSSLNYVKDDGTFVCRGCGSPLFTTRSKFDSGTGWPSFTYPIDAKCVEFRTDYKLIVPRTECRCAVCQSHLGHVFPDGPEPTGLRYCLNGIALQFRSDEENPELAISVSEKQVATNRKKGEKGKDNNVVHLPRPPVEIIMPGIMLNAGLAIAIVASFFLGPRGKVMPDLSVLDYFPLVLASYFGWLSLRDIMRLLR